jgi:hypothetical protein
MASFNSEDKILNQEVREDLFNNKPFIEAIARTHPIVFMDEPQEGMDTENSRLWLAKLSPLFKFRYSATHAVKVNMLYQLTPSDSYRLGLVKKIEVLTVTEKNDEATLKIEISEVQETKTAPEPVQERFAEHAVDDLNVHYAAHVPEEETVPYQDPARVDEFIEKMAAYHNVKEGELTCSSTNDSNVVSRVYVFPDKKEVDVFGRLLQVACWYSDETPGYHLNFSHQQFFFELKDKRKQLQYRWIAERMNGKILLYGTNAPIGANTSSACYMEYRDKLMHTQSINTKTREI